MVMQQLSNLAFVVIWLVIAAAQIFGIDSGNLALKTAVPKFALALILLNFSFLGCKVVIDAANVVTMAIAALPYQTGMVKFSGGGITDYSFSTNKQKAIAGCEPSGGVAEIIPQADNATTYSAICKNKIPQDEFLKNHPNGLGYLLATNMAILPNLVKVSAKVHKISDLTVNIIFSLVLGIALVLAILAMTVAFLARLLKLWIFIVLCPLAFIGIVFPNLLGKDNKLFSISGFINEAFMTAKVNFALAVGFILINTLIPEGVTGASIGEISMTLHGGVSTMGDLQGLLYEVMIVAVLWTGVFASFENTSAKVITDKIKGFGEHSAKWLGKRLQYAPIIPVPEEVHKGGTASFAGLSTQFRDASYNWEQRQLAPYRMDSGRILTGGEINEIEVKLKKGSKLDLDDVLSQYGRDLGKPHSQFRELLIKNKDRIPTGAYPDLDRALATPNDLGAWQKVAAGHGGGAASAKQTSLVNFNGTDTVTVGGTGAPTLEVGKDGHISTAKNKQYLVEYLVKPERSSWEKDKILKGIKELKIGDAPKFAKDVQETVDKALEEAAKKKTAAVK